MHQHAQPADSHVVHLPVRPVRLDNLGEVAFFAEWSELMATPPAPNLWGETQLEVILAELGGWASLRRAAVAASMAKWLGTAVGRSFIEAAGALEQTLSPPMKARAWSMAWAAANVRSRQVGGGVRQLESILAFQFNADGSAVIPDLSLDDHEVAEQFVMWLGSKAGQAYIQRAESRLQRAESRLQRLQAEASKGCSSPDLAGVTVLGVTLTEAQVRHLDSVPPYIRGEMSELLAKGVEVIIQRQTEFDAEDRPFAIMVKDRQDFWIDCCATEEEARRHASDLGLRVAA